MYRESVRRVCDDEIADTFQRAIGTFMSPARTVVHAS